MSKLRGFSLIELMIVLAITSILASLAYANYTDRIIRARRLDGKVSLLALANQIERFSTYEHTYKLSPELKQKLPQQSTNGFYQLSIIRASDRAFKVQATPIKTQTDKQCESFTFDQIGHKGLAAGPWGEPTGDVDACWN